MAASATVKRKPRPKRPKQEFLPGMAPVTNKKVDEAADLYYDAKIESAKLSKEAKEAEAKLIEVMKKARLERYVMPDGKIVTVNGKTIAKITKKKPPREKRPRKKADANGQPAAPAEKS